MFSDTQQIRNFKASTPKNLKREEVEVGIQNLEDWKAFVRMQRDFLIRENHPDAQEYSSHVKTAIQGVKSFGVESVGWDWKGLCEKDIHYYNTYTWIKNAQFFRDRSDRQDERTGVKHLCQVLVEVSDGFLYRSPEVGTGDEPIPAYNIKQIRVVYCGAETPKTDNSTRKIPANLKLCKSVYGDNSGSQDCSQCVLFSGEFCPKTCNPGFVYQPESSIDSEGYSTAGFCS